MGHYTSIAAAFRTIQIPLIHLVESDDLYLKAQEDVFWFGLLRDLDWRSLGSIAARYYKALWQFNDDQVEAHSGRGSPSVANPETREEATHRLLFERATLREADRQSIPSSVRQDAARDAPGPRPRWMIASVPVPAAEGGTTHRSTRTVHPWERSDPLALPVPATIRAFLGHFLHLSPCTTSPHSTFRQFMRRLYREFTCLQFAFQNKRKRLLRKRFRYIKPQNFGLGSFGGPPRRRNQPGIQTRD